MSFVRPSNNDCPTAVGVRRTTLPGLQELQRCLPLQGPLASGDGGIEASNRPSPCRNVGHRHGSQTSFPSHDPFAHDPVILMPSKRLKGSFLTRKRPVKKETARNDGSWIHHLRQICTNIAQTPMSMCIRHAKIRLRTPALIQCSSASAGKMCLAA